MRQTVEILLNLIEQLNLRIKDLEAENQKLRDENNRLKGEQGKPDIKTNKPKGFNNDHSSEQERKTPKNHTKGSKNVSPQYFGVGNYYGCHDQPKGLRED